MKLQNIRIVMIGTSHPGNIGAAARAMLNMSIERLALVAPQCKIGEVAYARASGANQVLDNRETHTQLADAVADCKLVIATTARRRSLAWPEFAPRQMVENLFALDDDSQVALVFGREDSGLSNDELQLCNQMVCIPTNPDFSSLNVASAIQVMCYEIYQHQTSMAEQSIEPVEDPLATSSEVEGYLEHLHRVMEATDFLNPDQPKMLLRRLRRLYLRTHLSHIEVNILRGILTAVEKSLD